MPYESPASSDRSTALRRGLIFIVLTSPIWLVPKRVAAVHPAALLGVLLGVTLLFLWWDNRSPSELGLELSWRPVANFVGGLFGGTLLIAVIAVLLRGDPAIRLGAQREVLPKAAAIGLRYLLVSAGVEELLFRGYGFERLITAIGLWPAQLIVALMYASYNLLNGTPWQAAFTVTVIGSLMFGLVFARTRSVLAATGFHAASNWARDAGALRSADDAELVRARGRRTWTAHERQTTVIILDGVALVACALLYWSIRRHDRQPLDV